VGKAFFVPLPANGAAKEHEFLIKLIIVNFVKVKKIMKRVS
jgi:hypothetical protein